jgi:hypothetical protein
MPFSGVRLKVRPMSASPSPIRRATSAGALTWSWNRISG